MSGLIEILRELIAAILILASSIGGAANQPPPAHPADQCQEDEAWTAVHFQDPNGIEDIHGVTRACVNLD